MIEASNSGPDPSGRDAGKAHGLLRFPGEDDGRSLTQMAQRDLDAALQLLAQRAQYITAASGSAIALREEGEMVCRASAGSSAPGLGSHLQVDSGLSGESVRTRQILRCDNAETDSRVNRETCKALGISSVIVMPLIQDDEVAGVFELFSERVAAFEERDVVALQRIAAMILTAVGHANAAKQTDQELRSARVPEPEVASSPPAPAPANAALEGASKKLWSEPANLEAEPSMALPEEEDEPLFALKAADSSKIGKCTSCGFPVSEGRTLCLDCERAKSSGASTDTDFLLNLDTADPSWFAANKYLVIAMALAVILLISLVLRFR